MQRFLSMIPVAALALMLGACVSGGGGGGGARRPRSRFAPASSSR